MPSEYRLAVMRHAAASHTTLAGIRSAISPPALVRGELEEHLASRAAKPPHLMLADQLAAPSPVRCSLLGVRCTEASVVATIFRVELWAEEQVRDGAAVVVVAEIDHLRAQLAGFTEESQQREGVLHEQLALANHECWVARQGVEAARHSIGQRQVRFFVEMPLGRVVSRSFRSKCFQLARRAPRGKAARRPFFNGRAFNSDPPSPCHRAM